jgi:NADH dehydrogenase FAD-containing subunit
MCLIIAQFYLYRCELLVVGGGSGGCSMAAKYAAKLGANKVVIVEPQDVTKKNDFFLFSLLFFICRLITISQCSPSSGVG